MSALLSASDIDFWMIGREVALLLKDRAGIASPALVDRVEERICQTGYAYYDRYTVEPGETDWRAHALDAAVWLRLNMLQDAGVLSEMGDAELSAIKERRDYLDRVVEDRDFFKTYSSGVRLVVGDPAPIMEAADDDRLRVARELAYSPEFDLQQGWSAFCLSDPQGAFDSLSKGDLTPENGALWNQFLGGLAFGEEASKEIRDRLSIRAFEYLSVVDADTLRPMISGLSDLIFSAPRQCVEDVDGWLERLWKMVSEQREEQVDLSTDLYERAINSAAGRLVQSLLLEIDSGRQQGIGATELQRQLLGRIAGHEGTAGQLGRAVLARGLAFLLSIDGQYIAGIMGPRMNTADSEGAALRAVMLKYGSITPELTQVFG